MRILLTAGIVLALTAGCAGDGQRTPSAADVVLSPVSMAGAVVSFAGDSLQVIGSPSQWGPEIPDEYHQPLLEEQRSAIIAAGSIEVPRDFVEIDSTPRSYGYGFGYGQEVSSQISPIFMQTEIAAQRRFRWFANHQLPDVAKSFPGEVIVYNPMVMSTLSPAAAQFMMLHEAGHHVLGHTSNVGVVTGLQQPWLLPQMEADADCFAARTMVTALGAHPQLVFDAAFQLFARSPGDATHAPGPIRIAAVRECLLRAR